MLEHSNFSDRPSDVCRAQAEPSRVCTSLSHQHLSFTEGQHLSSCSELPAADDHTQNFECNSCMHLACDPVVTMCGHLFCWPCLYHHVLYHHSFCGHQCPVCNADVHNRIVPLYGCGRMMDASVEDGLPGKAPGMHIPSRPAAASARSAPGAGTIFDAIDHRSEPADSPAFIRRRRRRRRFSNEKVFVLHWAFICLGLIASGMFLA